MAKAHRCDGRHRRVMIDWDNRQFLALPGEMKILEVFATQPGNIRSRKPSRLIWMYTLGKAKAEIVADLRVAESTLARWFGQWVDDGVSGVTGFYHSPDDLGWP